MALTWPQFWLPCDEEIMYVIYFHKFTKSLDTMCPE